MQWALRRYLGQGCSRISRHSFFEWDIMSTYYDSHCMQYHHHHCSPVLHTHAHTPTHPHTHTGGGGAYGRSSLINSVTSNYLCQSKLYFDNIFHMKMEVKLIQTLSQSLFVNVLSHCCGSATKSCLTLCDPLDRSMPGFTILSIFIFQTVIL